MNPYEELGVDPKADTPAIKRAYRKRAKKAHPDGGGTQEAFDRLNQAHLVLSDPVRRARFDETGKMEDVTPDIQDQAALQEISGALSAVLADESNIPDAKAMIIKLLRQKKGQGESQSAPLKRAIARAEKIKKKFKRKGKGENVMARMIDWQLSQWKTGADSIAKQIGVLDRAIEIMKDYDFEADPMPEGQSAQSAMMYGPRFFPFR